MPALSILQGRGLLIHPGAHVNDHGILLVKGRLLFPECFRQLLLRCFLLMHPGFRLLIFFRKLLFLGGQLVPGGVNFLQALLHLGAHGFQPGLVILHGRQAVHGLHQCLLVLLQCFLCIGGGGIRLLGTSLGFFQHLFCRSHHVILGRCFVLALMQQFFQLNQPIFTFPLLLGHPLPVFLPGFPGGGERRQGALGFVHLIGTVHQGIPCPG